MVIGARDGAGPAGGGEARPSSVEAGSALPFAHLQAPNAALYRETLTAFARARDRFIVHLRPEDVAGDLGRPGDADAVVALLDQLAQWGNLRADPDTGRVTTVEDFHRARYLYQLTPAGQAAEEALAVYDAALGRRGALQSVALDDITSQLRALLELASAQPAELDPAKVHLLMLGLAERFTGLADNAQAFMASLRRVIDFADGDVEAFVAYKQRLIDYINRFIADLANRGAQIATLLGRIDAVGVDRLLVAVARREASDALPDLPPDEPDGPDLAAPAVAVGSEHGASARLVASAEGASAEIEAAQVAAEEGAAEDVAGDVAAGGRADAEAAVRSALDDWRNRWRGLHDWFVSADTRHPSQARLLRGAAITAITQLVDTVAALNERRAGRSDRSADFRALARWFAEAPDDAAAHRLWRAAFGLTSARHLTVSEETVAAWREEEPAPSTPWAAAPPVRISPQLRRTGSYERRGAPNRVADRAEQRRALAVLAAQEAEQAAAARARLATGRPVLLRDLEVLDTHAFRLFLSLLGDALAARLPGQREVETTSSDGTILIRLSAVPGGGTVAIETEDGVLHGPEHVVEIVDLTARGDLPERAAPTESNAPPRQRGADVEPDGPSGVDMPQGAGTQGAGTQGAGPAAAASALAGRVAG
ncbi:TIGR02677 family protein [Pseudofrankia asymbiotica]|uniref:TIGR02677 family protein n=1 Tax=Pseudofrankia asymbiotica TaxID=1834516 RepID=UPI001F51D620|nr:TIGR02677 family protein [Pseudofrankia asymbiotica]